MIDIAIRELTQKRNLTSELMQGVMEEIMSGKATTAQIVSFLTALSNKGETKQELTAALLVMRKYATRIYVDKEVILDTCGTGGDKKGTFNISTAVAFVAAAAGITVAKHGNRAVSSSCGSADILEALGININMDKEKIERCLRDIGVAFLFAPNLHPAMKYALPARKQLGKKTIFNLLGPLSNPAGATHQLVGVYDRGLTEVVAGVLMQSGTKHTLVVHGEDGLDEFTTTAKTFISEAQRGKINNYEIDPEDFGLPRAKSEDLLGSGVAENARMLVDIFKGRAGPLRDIVLLNAAAAIYVADKAGSIKEALALATNAIDTGRALNKLELLKEYSLA